MVITTPERARDLRQKPALIRGIACAAGADQEQMTSFYRPDISYVPEMDLVAKRVYEISGLRPDDVDAAVIYDAFTSIVLFQLESFGFCKRGEAKDFVQGGNLGLVGPPADQHARRPALRGLHPRRERRGRGRAARSAAPSPNQPKKNDHVLVTSGIGVPTSAMILGQMN